jgi:MerR family transcriptional regulator/heat shock protein HspR
VRPEGGTAPSDTSRARRTIDLPDDAAPLYTVSQAAQLLDMQPAFIRRLDAQGVVIPARSAGGQRRYSRNEIDHIATLAGLMSEGMTLAGAQRIIELENEIADLRRQLANPPIPTTAR